MLFVNRWTKGGHNRLYVADHRGPQVGWLDLHSNERIVVSRAHEEEMHALLDLHQGRLGPLAGQAPGKLVRQEANKEFEAKPIRTLLNRLFDVVHTDERAWRLGAEGEEAVADSLDVLTHWKSVHSIPCPGGWDIDHFVVGPGGAFAINAKHHPNADVWIGGDAVLVAGARVGYVASARRQPAFASERLSRALGMDVRVKGGLAFLGDGRFTVKTPPHDVLVADVDEVANQLRRLPRVLDAWQTRAIHAAATHATTWA